METLEQSQEISFEVKQSKSQKNFMATKKLEKPNQFFQKYLEQSVAEFSIKSNSGFISTLKLSQKATENKEFSASKNLTNEKKEKRLDRDENAIIEKEKRLDRDENTIRKKEERLDRDENTIRKKEERLDRDENAIRKKEERLDRDENAIREKEEGLDRNQHTLDEKLVKKEDKIINDDELFKKKKNISVEEDIFYLKNEKNPKKHFSFLVEQKLSQEENKIEEGFAKISEKLSKDISKESENQEKNKFIKVPLDESKWSINKILDQQTNEKLEIRTHFEDTKTTSSSQNHDSRLGQGKEEKKDKYEKNNPTNKNEGFVDKQVEKVANIFSENSNQTLNNNKHTSKLVEKGELWKNNKKLFNDLVQKAKVNLRSDGSSMASIRMRPAEIGRMTLNLELVKNQIQAKILVDSQMAKNLLIEEMQNLQSEFQRQGLQIENLSIRVRESVASQFSFEESLLNNESKENARNFQEKGKENIEEKEIASAFPEATESYDINSYLNSESINISV